MPPEPQGIEPRNDTVSIAVTASEKRDVRFVADALGVEQSALLREKSVNEVLRMAPALREKLRVVVPDPKARAGDVAGGPANEAA